MSACPAPRHTLDSTAITLLTLLLAASLLPGVAPGRDAFVSAAQTAGGLDRPSDPVVMRGQDLPALRGAAPGELVAWRHAAGAWEQVPVQVDERAWVDFGRIYNEAQVGAGDIVYSDPNTFTGPDPDATFDADDELVFMAKDAGAQAPDQQGGPPNTVPGSGVEVRLMDPLDPSRAGYIYLFRQTGGIDPGAGRSYVSYSFSLDSGPYLTTYNLQNGPNPENSVASTAHYSRHFSDRWVDDGLSVTASNANGTANGADILDRHKSMYQPGDCRRTEETFSEGKGAFVANRAGPVRAVRSYIGANSGTYTQRDHLFYERRQDVATILRVHQVGGVGDFFDYSPAASGMTYRNDLNPAGALVDGVPETLATGPLRWEMVAGPQGSVTLVHEVVTNIAGLPLSSYYLDDDTPGDAQCTGDAYAYAFSGTQVGEVACTDPSLGCANRLTTWRRIYYDGPGLAASDAAARADAALNPPAFTVRGWPPAVPPAPPTGLAATAASSTQINLAWADNSSDEDGFRLERCQGVGCTDFAPLTQVGANVSGYQDAGLSASTTYRYRVRAYSNAGGDSAYSNEAAATTPAPPQPPAAPSGLALTVVSSSQINLKWVDNAGNEDGFAVERCAGANCTNFVEIGRAGANATTYSNTGLARNTTYRYRVRAFNVAGFSAYSNIAKAATKR